MDHGGHRGDSGHRGDNDPTREFSGIDDQLDRAISELRKAMEAKPVTIPKPPAYPDKSK